MSSSVDGDSYLIPATPASAETKVNGSRFVADLCTAASPEAAIESIDSIRRRLYDATHHCWAFRVGVDSVVSRSADDGEPSGTAGLPILRRIEASELNNVVVVVTRYFGGTKLGTGGLIRAYGGAASAAIDAAGVRSVAIESTFTTVFDYDETAAVQHAIAQVGGRVTGSIYGARTQLTFRVPRSVADVVDLRFREATADRVQVSRERDESSRDSQP